MIKSESLNKYTWVGLLLVLVYLFFVAYIRFTHQDIGWYYAYADRLAHKFSLNHSQSTWSFADANGDNGAGGIVFILLQFVAIVISSNDLLAIKILAGLIAFSVFAGFYFLLKNRLGIVYAFGFSLFLLIDPLFSFQVMNRPEMLGCSVALLIFYIGLSQNESPWKYFWIVFLTALLVDIHPISVYMVLGFNFFLFLKNYRKILYFIGGGILGLALITGLNYIFNHTLGIFAFFGDSNQYMNDHYFPLFTDPVNIILSRPVIKLKYFIVYLLCGALLYFVIRYFRELKSVILSRFEYRVIFMNAIVFFFISNLFSEGGNGYNLYSLIIYLPAFIILYNGILKLVHGNMRLLFISILMVIPAAGLYKTIPRINQWRIYNSYFQGHYPLINQYIKDGDRILLRPNFSFALSGRRVFCEPIYPVLMNMYYNKRDFPRTILAKNYDIVAIDESFLHDADIRTPVDKYSYGTFYKRVQEVKFDTGIVSDMVSKGVFTPVMEFDDFYHGKTVFYQVNKNQLKTYCNLEAPKL